MKLTTYSPTFRNVLLREMKQTKTKGGIYIPSVEFAVQENTKLYEVIKTGKDCLEVQEGDIVKIMKGLVLDTFELEAKGPSLVANTDREMTGVYEFCQAMEQQIIGYWRPRKGK